MTSDSQKPARARRRLFWAVVASVLLNIVVWATYPRHFASRDEPKPKIVASIIHISRRRVPKPRARRPPPPRAKPSVVHTLAPIRPVTRKPLVPKKIVALLVPPRRRHLPLLHVQGRPARPLTRPTPAPYHEASGSLTFTPHHSGRFRLPPNWATQDLGNGAAADTSLWLDFKHAKGAFVPRVLVLHLKTAFISGPTLQDAVHDITDSLEPDDILVTESKAQRVCNGTRDGWYLAYERPDDDMPGQYENVIFMAGDTVYRVVYSRPDGQAEDPATRAALNTICPSP